MIRTEKQINEQFNEYVEDLFNSARVDAETYSMNPMFAFKCLLIKNGIDSVLQHTTNGTDCVIVNGIKYTTKGVE